MKSEVQPTNLEAAIAQANSTSSKVSKCVALLLDKNDAIADAYDLASDVITDVRNALDETVEFLHDINYAFWGELTQWT